MDGPAVVAWLLVALSGAGAVACGVRPGARGEALLAAGMAVMAVPMSVFEPPRWGTGVLAVVFGAAALHQLRPSRHSAAHRMHHSVCAWAMVYMAAAMAGAAGGAHAGHHGHGHGGAGAPLLTGLLLAYFAGYVLRSGVRLVSVASGPAAAVPPPSCAMRLRHAPEVATACRVAMALAMFAMLLTL